MARLAQSVERKALNLVVVGSSPTVGVLTLARFLRSKLSFVSATTSNNTPAHFPHTF